MLSAEGAVNNCTVLEVLRIDACHIIDGVAGLGAIENNSKHGTSKNTDKHINRQNSHIW